MARDGRPTGPRALTIADVAASAQVSPATVSRVLNGSPSVDPAMRSRVDAAVEQLGYRPSGPARALRRQTSAIWYAIVADVENPFFTAVVRAAEDASVGAGYQVVLCNSDEDLAKEAQYLGVAIAEKAGGVMIAVASTEDSDLSAIVERGIPIVAIDRRPARQDIDSVVVDNRRGGVLATQHLIDEGATRVACITGPRRLSTAEERLVGFRAVVEERLGVDDPTVVRHADFRADGGYAATASLLADGSAAPDALFVTNNLMTLGALRAVRDAGLRVPDDVLLVGYDDSLWTGLVQPSLTVVAQPTHAIGTVAAELLSTASVAGGGRHMVLDPTLIVRESSTRT